MATANVIEFGHRGPKRLSNLELKKRALLGELVIATGAGNLSLDALAGALLLAAESDCAEKMSAWEMRGAAFFANEGQGEYRF